MHWIAALFALVGIGSIVWMFFKPLDAIQDDLLCGDDRQSFPDESFWRTD